MSVVSRIAMASSLIAMASSLIAMASNLIAMASSLIAMGHFVDKFHQICLYNDVVPFIL